MKRIRFLATTDLHGLFYKGQYTPRPVHGSIAGVREFVSTTDGDVVETLLLDAGDFMGGGLPSFLANHTAEMSQVPHIAAQLANLCGYAAMTAGNHDLDAGPEALARYASTLRAPLLAANIEGIGGIKRYTAVSLNGISVAIIGLITPDDSAVAIYQGASLLSLSEGVDMALAEMDADGVKPDMVLGLIHDGPEQCMRLAEERDVFDLIFCGHVHRQPGVFKTGRTVIINPGAYGRAIACATCTIADGDLVIAPEIIELPTAGMEMPPEMVSAGNTCLVERDTPLDTLLNETALRATDADAAVTDKTDTLLPAGFTLAESFACLPYDDRLCVTEIAQGDFRRLAEDPELSVLYKGTAEGETVRVALTTYLCRRLGLDPGDHPLIMPIPIRCLLLDNHLKAKSSFLN